MAQKNGTATPVKTVSPHGSSANAPSTSGMGRGKWSGRKPKRGRKVRREARPVVEGVFVVTMVTGCGCRSWRTDHIPPHTFGVIGQRFCSSPAMKRKIDAFYAEIEGRLYLSERRAWYEAHGCVERFDSRFRRDHSGTYTAVEGGR